MDLGNFFVSGINFVYDGFQFWWHDLATILTEVAFDIWHIVS
jgi:hypothetical protein